MTDEQKAAFVMAASARVIARVMGMAAENEHRVSCGNSIAYGCEQFEQVINDEDIHRNSVLTLFHG